MKLGFPLPHLMRVKAVSRPWEASVTGADQTRLIKWADQLGYAMISVPEHYVIPSAHLDLTGPHHFSAFPTMAYIAGASERLRVNSCIALLPLQHPVITAKALSSMDWLSGGRVTVTFGVGWLEAEFEALGVPFHERGAMSDEYIRAIIELWTSPAPRFEGKYVSFRDVAFEPKPVQKPHLPVWFGGDSDAALRRASRYGSGWWPFLTRPEDIPSRIDFIKSQADDGGRLTDVYYGFDTTSIGEGHVIQEDPRARPGMTKQEIIDRLSWFGELGVTMSSVPIPDVVHIEEYFDYSQWVAEEIMPAVA